MRSYKCCTDNKVESVEIKGLSTLLKLVSDRSRLQLLCILSNGEHCVCELIAHLKLSQSLISHHLKDLKEFDLVTKNIDGRWSYYSITPKGRQITNLIFQIKI